ncbi:MAG: phosphoribosyltransferase [Clostridia bacterium]|nr:phosphoribosyltransferase [Clostridia bacterium]
MPTKNIQKMVTKGKNLVLRVSKGHFATSHSHINYYIDVTMQKTRLSEAQAVAHELVSYYNMNTIVDTILCLDGMEVVGTCLAGELTLGDFRSINAHQTIYVVTPEHTSGSQLIFRDNMMSAIKGKNILILAASVTTGYTAAAAVEAIKYYVVMMLSISDFISSELINSSV